MNPDPNPAPVITIKPRISYEVIVDGKTIGQGPIVGEWEGMLKIKVGRGDIIVARTVSDLGSVLEGIVNLGKPEVVQVVKATPAVVAAIGEAHAEAFPNPSSSVPESAAASAQA